MRKVRILFDGKLIGHPEWTPYYGQWRHYFSFGGRLRSALMRRFNYPIDRVLLNFMACDGSSIGESHSALEPWATLATPPNPENNGLAVGPGWEQLHPAIFSRPGGARPDLVIFGSGANEKIDGAEEVAVFDNLKGRLYLIVHADPAEPQAYARALRRRSPLANAHATRARHSLMRVHSFSRRPPSSGICSMTWLAMKKSKDSAGRSAR